MGKLTVTIKLKDGKTVYRDKEVILSTFHKALLFGKGENAEIIISKEDLKYKTITDGS